MPEANPWKGVGLARLSIPVSPGQYEDLIKDMIQPGIPVRVTHKISVGLHYTPGTYVVVGGQQLNGQYVIQLSRVEDS
jgi:hypothetical protein